MIYNNINNIGENTNEVAKKYDEIPRNTLK